MKKLAYSAIALVFLIFGFSVANANTVYFAVDPPQAGIDAMESFQFDIVFSGAGTIGGGTLDVFYIGEAVPAIGRTGGVPTELAADFPWDIFTGGSGVVGFNDGFPNFPLTAGGAVFSYDNPESLELANWVFAGDGPGGTYPLPFNVGVTDLGGGDTLYTFQPQVVPIPPTVLLLGAGLLGLVGVRRRVKS